MKIFANVLRPLELIKNSSQWKFPWILQLPSAISSFGNFQKSRLPEKFDRFNDKINKIDFVPPKPYLMKYLTAQFLQIKA